MNVHDQTGYALECYRAGIKAGAGHVSTAARPLAGGNSVPAAADVVALADELGVDTDVDREAIDWLDQYFRYVAHVYGKPHVTHIEPDEERFRRYVGHQIPGGMMSHYESQLDGLGLLNRIDEVLEEAARVRVEIGCPVMVTPFSQLVGVQAMFNVLDGKRYHTVPADLRTYVRGYYGQPPGPMDPYVFDRLTDGQPAVDATEIFSENMMDAMRREMPPGAGPDDIFFWLFSKAADVQAMRAEARQVRIRRVTPLIALIEQLTTCRDVTRLDIRLRDKEDR
jgi:pyruvate/oxaloacetate carboxyltransferase